LKEGTQIEQMMMICAVDLFLTLAVLFDWVMIYAVPGLWPGRRNADWADDDDLRGWSFLI